MGKFKNDTADRQNSLKSSTFIVLDIHGRLTKIKVETGTT
jgi:hypothetical protein